MDLSFARKLFFSLILRPFPLAVDLLVLIVPELLFDFPRDTLNNASIEQAAFSTAMEDLRSTRPELRPGPASYPSASSRAQSPYLQPGSSSNVPLLQRHSNDSSAPEAVSALRPPSTAQPNNPVAALTAISNIQERQLAPLDFWPPILKWYSTLSLVILYLGSAGAIVALWLAAGTNGQYKLSSENVRMISRYFPSALGTLNVILFRHLVREYIRMKPFVAMADQGEREGPGEKPSKCVSGAFFPWQDILVSRESTTFISLLCQIMVGFIVSLKVALLASGPAQAKDSEHGETATWTLTLRVYPALFLIIGHVIMTLYVLWTAYLHKGKSTGLRWDPVTIADYCALFSQCNVAEYFSDLELLHNRKARDVMSTQQIFRLGYWEEFRPNSRNKLVYGVGATWRADVDVLKGHVSPPYKPTWWDILQGNREKPSPVDECRFYHDNHPLTPPLPGNDPAPLTDDAPTPQPDSKQRLLPCKQGTWPACEHYPHRHSPGCSRGYVIVAWLLSVAALVVAIYGLVNGIVFKGFVLPKDWSMPSTLNITDGKHTLELPPIDPTDPESKLVVYALVFRSAPVYVAGVFTATIVEWVDLNMRFMQPFINMFAGAGDAADTVLLAYITTSPLQVPITALAKGHYRVALFSTLNTLSPLFPIFIGGLLTLADGGDTVFFTFSLSAYIGIMAFLVAWTLAFPFAYPVQRRLLPRQFYSMADLIAMCYKSSFLQKPYLDFADRNRTPTKEIMEARILLSGDRFLFGHYTDDHECRHVGFDVHSTLDLNTGRVRDTHLVQAVTPAGELDALVSQTVRTMTTIFYGNPSHRQGTGIGNAGSGGKSNVLMALLHRLLHRQKKAQADMELRSMQQPRASATGLEDQRDNLNARQRGGVAGSFVPPLNGPAI